MVPWTRKRSGQEQEILMFAPNWRTVFFIFLYCKVALYCELGFWKKCVCDLFSKRKNTSKILCWEGGRMCNNRSLFQSFPNAFLREWLFSAWCPYVILCIMFWNERRIFRTNASCTAYSKTSDVFVFGYVKIALKFYLWSAVNEFRLQHGHF